MIHTLGLPRLRVTMWVYLCSLVLTLFALQLDSPNAGAADQVGHAFGQDQLCQVADSPGDGAVGVKSLVTVWDIFAIVLKNANNFGSRGDAVLEAYIGSTESHTDWGEVPKYGHFVGFAAGRFAPQNRAVAFMWSQTNNVDIKNRLELLAGFDVVASPGLAGTAVKQYEIEIETQVWDFDVIGSGTRCLGGGVKWDAKGRALADGRMINETQVLIITECNPYGIIHIPSEEPDHLGACVVGAGGGTNRDPRHGWYFGDFDSNEFQDATTSKNWHSYGASQTRISDNHHHVYRATSQSGWAKWGACGHDEGRYGSGGPCIPNNTENH